jgi:hypothetical protein
LQARGDRIIGVWRGAASFEAESRNVSLRQVRLSTNATLEQNLRFTSRCADLDIHATHASFLQLSKIVVPFNTYRSERLRSRRSAISVWSRKREKNITDNKKPGNERRADPSIS